MTAANTDGADGAEARLRSFIDKFSPDDRKLIRAVRSAVRRRFPTANELVYDNYNFFVIGYSPTERPGDAILSIAARANGIGLCFIHGASLPDPKGLLLGTGKQTRFVRLASAGQLLHPDIEEPVGGSRRKGGEPAGCVRQRQAHNQINFYQTAPSAQIINKFP